MALGDSLTAGYGLAPAEALPVVLEQALRDRGHDVVIENAGVSGDTATAGADRVDWAVADGADGVILALGANDALRGVDPGVTREALARALDRLAERGIPVMLAGMMAPRNLGPDYAAAFDAIHPGLAEARGLVLYPFLLDGVAAVPSLNQADGIHPNAEGVRLIVERMLPAVERFLERLGPS